MSIEERSGALTFGDQQTIWDYHVSLHEMSLLYLSIRIFRPFSSYLSLHKSGLTNLTWGSLGGDLGALGLTWVGDPGNVYMLYMQNDGCILTRPSVTQL